MRFRLYGKLRESSIVLSMLVLSVLAGCSSVPLTAPPSQSTASSPAAVKPKSSTHPVLPPAGSGRGGYYLDDGPGEQTPDGLQDMPDAVPKIEPYSRQGNKPYVVFGKRYVPITDDRPLTQRGYGSWYGKKFHGQKTSSGELYDMYQMTAAHPTLPIPSYARVTNLANGTQVIVRVNDRGPFHSSRIIDLSYTAALKLGYIGKGSAELKVERLLPADIEQILAGRQNGATAMESSGSMVPAVETSSLPPASQPVSQSLLQPTSQPVSSSASSEPVVATLAAPSPVAGFYLQFGAYSQAGNAEAVRARLAQNAGSMLPALRVEPSNNLYRLYSGPFASRGDAAAAALQVEQKDGIKPFIVQR